MEEATKLVNKEVTDKWVRDANPSVQRAYDNYKMLLELSRT